MKRLFALDLSMRSTACNYDPCIISDDRGRPCVLCDDCKVTFISDRFLGEDFQRKVIGKAFKKSFQKFTYVIIADAVGCNLNCWFCYAWKFLKRSVAQEKCETSFISPERLAEQFFCKFNKVSSMEYMIKQIKKKEFLSGSQIEKSTNHIRLNLPLTRIRISGGEPIFSDDEVLIETDKGKPVYLSSVDYWLIFFEKLDEMVGKLKEDKVINLIDVDKWDGTSPHLSCLCEVTGRLSVRFDTNGVPFGNEKITEAFIGGLYRLHKEGKLNNLFIQIDYSFKGATPTEYLWSQSLSLPVSPDKNIFSFSPQEHPQYLSFKNIVDTIKKYVEKDCKFNECIDITVERGIDHDRKEKVFLYYPDAMDWDNFSKITGIKFSPVINCFDLNFRWRTEAKMYRYSRRGAVIKMLTEKEVLDNTRNTLQELLTFRKLHRNDPSFKTIVYPIGEPLKLKRFRRLSKKQPSQTTLEGYGRIVGWILSGNPENWKVALKNNMWGVNPELRALWKQVKKDDLLFFYVTRPVSGIIGVARVEEGMEEKSLLWPDEIREGKAKYPYRIKFRIMSVLGEVDWKTRRLPLKHLNVIYYRGLNAIYDKNIVKKMIEMMRIFSKNQGNFFLTSVRESKTPH